MEDSNIVTTNVSKKKRSVLPKIKTPSPILVSNVILANLSNKRKARAHTKTKGEVSGGGKKPWRQKGTGRARAGSNRSPLWVGGGVTFGPRKERNFFKRINRKQHLLVLNHLINTKDTDGKLKVVDTLEVGEAKTKQLIQYISSLGIDGTALIVLDNKFSDSKEGEMIYLSGRNISFLKVISVDKLNAYLISKYNWLIITKKALDGLNDKFSFIKEEDKKTNKQESKKIINQEKE